MQRARRLASLLVVAVVGVLALSACGRSASDVAAYVGDTTLSLNRIDEIYADVQTKFAAEQRKQQDQLGQISSPDPVKAPVTRQDVINLLISLDLGKQVAADNGFTVSNVVSAEQLAGPLRVPADAEYTQLWAEWASLYPVLGEKLAPADLSDEAILTVYAALAKTGAIRPNLALDQIREAFGDGGFVRAATAVSTALRVKADQTDTLINPRFRPVAVPYVVNTPGGLVFYELPLIDSQGAVTDLSSPAGAGTSAS